MSKLIHDLVSLSQYAGSSILLVQGAGGNTSVKSPDLQSMWIKASGFGLSDVKPGEGYIELRLPEISSAEYFASLAPLDPDVAHVRAIETVQDSAVNAGKLRPSLETLFHAVLGTYVLHTHSVYCNAFSCMDDGEEALASLSKDTLWVPYITPGYALGAYIRERALELAQQGRELQSILLENHGPITAAATSDEAVTLHQDMIAHAERTFGPIPEGALEHVPAGDSLKALAVAPAPQGFVRRASTLRILRQASLEADLWITPGPLIPDDVVYFGRSIGYVDASFGAQAVAQAAVQPGEGVIFQGPNERFVRAMEEGLAAHVLTRMLIARKGRARLLPQDAVEVLANMEAEKYRQATLAR